MAYTFYLTFINRDSADRTLDLILEETQDFQTISRTGEGVTAATEHSANALKILGLLRKTPGISQILLRDQDGWETEEIDLFDEDMRSGLSNRITEESGPFRFPDSGETSVYSASEASRTGLILASQSPRRRELLGLLNIPFTCAVPSLDEDALTARIQTDYRAEPFGVRAACTVIALAAAKAEKILGNNPECVVIGSDTIVTIDEEILGKPSSPEDALQMLRTLAGREHHVFTGVSIRSRERSETFFTTTRVAFFPWGEQEKAMAEEYVRSGLPLDKAGSYGIQDMGALFIRGIKGDFYTVMGLPVGELYRRLKLD